MTTTTQLIPPVQGQPFPLVSGETRSLDVDLEVGELFHAVARQDGVDVALRLYDPHADALIEADVPLGSHGSEELADIARLSGRHRLEVRALAGKSEAGHVSLRWEARPARDEDHELVEIGSLQRRAFHQLERGELDAARITLHRAVSLAEGASRRRRALAGQQLALLRLALCRVHHGLGQLDVALAFCHGSIATDEEDGDPTTPIVAAIAASYAGSLQLDRNQLESALDDFELSLELFRRIDSDRYQALVEAKLGSLHHRLGNLRPALEHLERALEIADETSTGTREHAIILVSAGSLSISLGRAEAGLERFRRAHTIYRSIGDDHKRGQTLDRLGFAALQIGDLETSETYLHEAIETLRAVEPAVDAARDLAMARLSLARLHLQNGQIPEARDELAKALATGREITDRQLEGAVLQELGNLELHAGAPQTALEYLTVAAQRLAESGDRAGDAMVRIRAAQALRAVGRQGAAWRRLEPALDTLESIRRAPARADVRIDYFAMRQEFFDLANTILLERHEADPTAGHHLRALEVHEQRRARDLLDSLTPASSTEIEPRDLEGNPEEELEAAIRQLAERAAVMPSSAVDRQLGRLVDRLHAARGARQRARAVEPPTEQPPTFEEIEALMEPGTLFVVVSLGAEKSAAWTLTRTADGAPSVEVHHLPARESIEASARRFARLVPRIDPLAAVRRDRAGRELSTLLLDPLTQRLEPGLRIVVVPTGDLQRVPFAALPHPRDPSRPLVALHEIVVLPSLSTLDRLRRGESRRSPTRRSLAVFADPVFSADDPRVAVDSVAPAPQHDTVVDRPTRRAAQILGQDRFERLLGSRREVESILALAGRSDTFSALGFSASRQIFWNTPLEEFRILHFATHGVQDPDHPELSGLVLSQIDPDGRKRAGFLHAFEISRRHLPADLVVLSACQTGRGVMVPGEGVLGLTRAFFQAGSARVLSSLWQVEDAATARLMSAFYRALWGNDLAPAAALRQAQLEQLVDPKTSSPGQWAGFILQGEWHPPSPSTLRERTNPHHGPPASSPRRKPPERSLDSVPQGSGTH